MLEKQRKMNIVSHLRHQKLKFSDYNPQLPPLFSSMGVKYRKTEYSFIFPLRIQYINNDSITKDFPFRATGTQELVLKQMMDNH